MSFFGFTAEEKRPYKPKILTEGLLMSTVKSDKSWIAAMLLCFFLGYLGVHRFYVGKIGTGILWLLTGGLFRVGLVIDFLIILCGGFTDSDGLPVKA